jgi:hypothetical protein
VLHLSSLFTVPGLSAPGQGRVPQTRQAMMTPVVAIPGCRSRRCAGRHNPIWCAQIPQLRLRNQTSRLPSTRHDIPTLNRVCLPSVAFSTFGLLHSLFTRPQGRPQCLSAAHKQSPAARSVVGRFGRGLGSCQLTRQRTAPHGKIKLTIRLVSKAIERTGGGTILVLVLVLVSRAPR